MGQSAQISIKALALSVLAASRAVPCCHPDGTRIGTDLRRNDSEDECWHCGGARICGCSTCWQSGPSKCVACKGSGRLLQWLQ